MLHRFSVKIGGASGTGINTVGMILARAFKRAHFYNTAYREYPSLIKGGYASYKLDISDVPINAISENTDVYISIDRGSFDEQAKEIKQGQIFIYDGSIIRPTEEQISSLNERSVKLIGLNLSQVTRELGAKPIMKNTVLMGAVWKLMGLDPEILIKSILDVFNKTPEIEEMNKKCAEKGFELLETDKSLVLEKFNPKDNIDDYIIITGNEAIGLGAIAAGVRAYFAYPMTPSSTILSAITKFAQNTGIIVKQAEDEITAVNMAIGANFAGTRAMTGTSGGGFDLMSEGVSLAGITETPLVVALAQRPGPATGLPTWTNQADLKLAINAGHGEFPRIVLAPGDPEECFYLTTVAHNLAEKYQTVVIVLTDKLLAENLYATKQFDQTKVVVDRGELAYEMEDQHKHRYEFTDSGISPRWVPGIHANTYIGNSDEHDEYGNSLEGGEAARKMLEKRHRKTNSILDAIPEPEILGEKDAEISFIGWGSTKTIVQDAINELALEGIKANMLYFKYVFPVKTSALNEFVNNSKNLVLIENNQTGQLGEILSTKMNLSFREKMLKYDGRPFWVEEVVDKVKQLLNK